MIQKLYYANRKFGEWEVDEYKFTVFNKKMNYSIEGDRLTEEDWIYHLRKKNWVDLNEFIPAYFYALSLKGITKLKIRTSYKNESIHYEEDLKEII